MSSLCKRDYFTYKILLLFVIVCESYSEMFITESKVDPFSLLLNNQREILDKMDYIMTKLQVVSDIEEKFSSLSSSVETANNKLDLTQKSIEVLSEKIQNITNFSDNKFSQVSRQNEGMLNISTNPCNELADIFKNGVNDIVRCNTVMSPYVYEDSSRVYPKKTTRDAYSKHFSMDDENIGLYGMSEDKHARALNSSAKTIIASDLIGEKLFSKLKSVINSKLNTTDETLVRVLFLLHNIEYRQHVSAISEDRRLDTLLHKIAIHQSVLEERIIKSLNRDFKGMHDDMKDNLQALKDNINNEQTMLNSLVSITTNLSMTLENIALINSTNYRPMGLPITPELKVCLNSSHNLQKTEKPNEKINSDINSQKMINETAELYRPPISFINQNLGLRNLSGSGVGENNSTKTAVPPESSLLNNLGIIFPTDVNLHTNATIRNKSVEDNATDSLDSISHDENIEANEDIVKQITDVKDLPGFENAVVDISKSISEQIAKIEHTLNKRLTETEDKLLGLRIHQTSTIYTHAKEVRYEMEKLERGISESIQSTGHKVSKRLDAARKALFAFIDASVTSVTSAAVTSSQAMGTQVARELKESIKEIGKKIENNSLEDESRCPEMYQRIGKECFMVLNTVVTTWQDGCRLCKVLGGDLAYISRDTDTKTLVEILRLRENLWVTNSMHSVTDASCEYYTTDEEREELTNFVSNRPVGVGQDGKQEVVRHGNNTDLNCYVLDVENSDVAVVSCLERFGLICQYGLFPFYA